MHYKYGMALAPEQANCRYIFLQTRIYIKQYSGVYRCWLFPNNRFEDRRCERLLIGGIVVRQDFRWDKNGGRIYYKEHIRGSGYNGCYTEGQVIGVY